MADVVLDVQKLMCPMPIVHISKQLKKMNVGQTLEATATDPVFHEDVVAFCKLSGNTLESVSKKDDACVVVIKKV